MAGSEARVGTALINYAAKDAGFTSTTKKVNRQLTGFEKHAGKAKRAAGRLTSSIAGMAKGYLGVGAAIGAALGGAGVGAFIKTQGEMATKMEQFARITGLTITELQIFQKGMGEFAIGTKTTNKALQTIAKATGEAKRGLKSYTDAFASLGISMDKLEGKSMQEVLNIVAEGLKSTEDTATRTSAAMLLFGGRGTEVAAALQKVNFENAEYVKSITDTGVITEKQSKLLHSVTAAYDVLGDTLTTQKQLLAAELAPEWVEMLGKMNELAPAIFEVLTPAFKNLVGVITNVVGGITNIISGLDDLIDRIFGTDNALDTVRQKSLQAQRDEVQAKLDSTSPANIHGRRSYESELKRLDVLIAAGQTGITVTERDIIQKQLDNIRSRIAQVDSGDVQLHPVQINSLRRAEQKLAAKLVDNASKTIEKVTEDASPSSDSTDGGNPPTGDTKKIVRKVDKSAKTMMMNRLAMFEMAAGTGDRAASESAAVAKETRDAVEKVWRDETSRFALAGRVSRFDVALLKEQSAKAGIGAYGGMTGPQMASGVRKQRQELTEILTGANDGIIQLSETTKQRLEPVFAGLDNQLSNFFTSIIDGTASAGDAFKNLAAQIAQAVFQALVLQPLVNSITGGIGNIFGFEQRARGGPVSARSPYIVGEKGPELFVPSHAGIIVPNHKMGGARAAGIVNQFTFNIESTDGPGVQRALDVAYPVFVQGALDAQQQAADRPGDLYD